jgi:hypothetical protein
MRAHPQAYQGAVEVLAALADKLRASPGRFFFGAQPCSLDALLFGHLAFYRHSPVAAPVLRDKVSEGVCFGARGGAATRARSTSCACMPPPPTHPPTHTHFTAFPAGRPAARAVALR